MISFTYTVTDPLGLHARPAGLLAITAKKCLSSIIIMKNEKRADAKRLIGLMGLGIKCGDTVTIEVSGDDEEVVSEQLHDFFEKNL